jgi:four helix bundle protein
MAPAFIGAMSIADELRQRTFRYALRVIAFCQKLTDTWIGREIGRQLLRAGMGTSANYWSACRGRSDREFIAKLGVAEDEAAESVMWLMLVVQSGLRQDPDARALLAEGREITAILSKSHKTARENRRRKKAESKGKRSKLASNQLTKLPTNQFTNSSEVPP